ncbi:MAG: EamA family transporter [Steroidobacteraceae bacterium]|jgi:inner membrane transporter RhtA
MSGLFPIALLLLAMASYMAGASVAKTLFAVINPVAVVALRIGFGTLILSAILRPWRIRVTRNSWRSLAIYGASLGIMNLLYYQALSRIPLGITTAIEFTGPLAVSIALSRQPIDIFWAALAASGLILLAPIAHLGTGLDPSGVLCALAAGGCWAMYIVFGQKAGISHGPRTVALGSLISAFLIVPVGIVSAGPALLSPSVLGPGLVIAILSTALPYPLEMVALTRLPARTFGVLLSIEPAMAALFGYALLGQRLSMQQAAAIAMIVLASIGAVATLRSTTPVVMTG